MSANFGWDQFEKTNFKIRRKALEVTQQLLRNTTAGKEESKSNLTPIRTKNSKSYLKMSINRIEDDTY